MEGSSTGTVPSIAERLRELADGEGDQPILQAQMRALATEIEAIAEEMRNDWADIDLLADRLAVKPEEKP